jgi:hypothetical protein
MSAIGKIGHLEIQHGQYKLRHVPMDEFAILSVFRTCPSTSD